jgi:hypothetical protein
MKRIAIASIVICTATAAPAQSQGPVSVERGLQVSIVGGCHDCHTEGYNEAEGKIDPDKAMRGSHVGFRGPWGTTYPTNLRQIASYLTEKGFVVAMKHLHTLPPMPWYNVRAMDESDIRSFYQYLKSLGDKGEPAPAGLGPDVEPKTPYIQMAPPQMPKS